MSEEDKILKHFNSISEKYDTNNEKLYWRLADKLLWDIIIGYIPNNKKFKFLDLGGGTGTWSKLILDKYPLSNGVLVDYSSGMLAEANKKLSNYKNRIDIINSDINNAVINEYFDVILNIYLLPFFNNTNYLINFIFNHLNQKGKVISVAENYYNGIALNILKGNIDAIKNMQENKLGKLSELVPILKFHTIEEISRIYNDNGIIVKDVYGYPVVSPIGYLEGLTSENNSISKILTSNFEDIYIMESEYIKKKELSSRGKYICIVGEKR